MKVFLPYLYWNVVFDNSRVVAEMGRAPAPFSKYCYPLLKFSRENHFEYPVPGMAGGERDSGSGFEPFFEATFERRSSAVTDLLLEAWVSGLVELTKAQWMLGGGTRWHPGEPLKLLFAGYNGTRNTGSDVRVEEMLRQVRHVLGRGARRAFRDDAEF